MGAGAVRMDRVRIVAPSRVGIKCDVGGKGDNVKLKVVIHEAEEGGCWAEVPAILGCATQGESFPELLENLYEAVEGCLAVDVENP